MCSQMVSGKKHNSPELSKIITPDNLPTPLQYKTYTGGHTKITPAILGHLKRLEPHLNGEYEIEDIIDDIQQRKKVLWVIYDTDEENPALCVLMEFHTFSRKKVCNVAGMVGRRSLEAWKLFQDFIWYWADLNGATEIRAMCRDSVARLSQKFGFKKLSNVVAWKKGE